MSNPSSPTSPSHAPGDAQDRLPPAATGPTFLGHPRGLFLLFLVEMWERFSYYGMRGLLVLYLTAAIAAYQLKPGVHTNTLRLEQATVAGDGKDSTPLGTTVLPLHAVTGDAKAPAPGAAVKPAGPLTFERLARKPDPAKPGKFIWEGTGQGLGDVVLTAKGKQDGGEPVRFRVHNPTDQPVKLTMKVERPVAPEVIEKALANLEKEAAVKKMDPADLEEARKKIRGQQDPDYKIYFLINDGTGVVSTNVQPDAALSKPGVEPYDISFDLNRIDSGRSWIKANANTLYGWYTGMAYLLPILGGLVADKLIGTHRSMIVGGLLIALGHIVLGVSGLGEMGLSETGMTVFVFGLALITIGTGHFKPSVSVMVGQLYPLGDPRREGAFSIFYMGINLGSFLCNLACGWLAAEYGWHYGFAAAAAGMILGLCTYVTFRSKYLAGVGEPAGGSGKAAPIFLPIGIVLAAGVAFLFKLGILGQFDTFVSNPNVIYVIVGLAVLYGIYFIASQERGDRGPVATIFIYMLFNALFWLSFEQAGSSLNTFTDELTDRTFLGKLVPSPYFQSINPLLIIIFAPIFGMLWVALAKRKTNVAQPYKIGMGLIFVGLGYVVMVLAATRLNMGVSKVSMIFISGCYFLHTVGEIILSPTGLSYVAKTAPKRHMSSLMGIWFISSFIAGLAAGKVGALVDPIIEGKVKLPWNLGGQADFFLLFVVTSCAAGVLIMLIAPLLTRLQRNRAD